MSTTYKVTVEVKCWKNHTCVGCGSGFRYLFKRTKAGEGASEEAAGVAAENAVVKALEYEVDQLPCPKCGLYQPDMVATRRRQLHLWVLAGAAVGITLAVILGGTLLISPDLAAWIGAGVGAAALLANLVVALWNPNSNLDANRRFAESGRNSRGLEVQSEGNDDNTADAARNAAGATSWLLILLVAAGTLAIAAPALLRAVNGWQLNNDWYWPVAGPGDDPYVYFPHKITSVKGYWRGNASAVVLNAQDVGLGQPNLSTSTSTTNWGDKISAKSSEKSSNSTLWVRVNLPKNAELAGKKLRIKMNLHVRYPQLMGGNNFEEVERGHEHTADITLASAGAGGTYRTAFWGGGVGGGLLVLLCTFALALTGGAQAKDALPTSVTSMGQDEQADGQA